MSANAAAPSSEFEWVKDLPIPTLTMTLYIPTMSVGAVIGRRGSTIAQIQRQAQQLTPNGAPPVRVSIVGQKASQTASSDGGPAWNDTATPQESPNTSQTPEASTSSSPPNPSAVIPYTYTELDWSSPQWTPVVIRAGPAAALYVASKFEELCSSMDCCILDLPIGRQRHAAIVGKRGMQVMQLSADSQCRIMVPPKELKQDIIQLEGELKNCVKCLQGLANILQNQDFKKTATHQLQLVVQSLPSQTKLRSVGRKTDTIIKKKKAEDEAWQLTIMGNNESQVQNALQLLQKWAADRVADAETTAIPSPRSPKGGRGGGGRGGGPGRGGSRKNNKGKGKPKDPKNSE